MTRAIRRSLLLPAVAAGLVTFACAHAALAEPLAADTTAATTTAPADAPVSAPAVDTLATVLPARTDSASSPGFNPRPTIGKKLVVLTGKPETVLRSGPGGGFAIVGTWPAGTRFSVIAKSGSWIGVKVSDTETGWVHASLCKELDDLSGLQYRPNARLYSRTGSYVLSAYGGAYAYDRKSNSAVIGGRLGYYVFDRVVAEAGVSWTHVRRPAEIVESLFDLRLEAEDFAMLFYQMNVTWELLPGRQMVPYVSGGVGSTLMLGRSTPAVNFGAGTRLFLSKRAAMRWDVRDFRFDNTSTSGVRTNNNVEFTLGTEYLY